MLGKIWIIYDKQRLAVNKQFADMISKACERRNYDGIVMIDTHVWKILGQLDDNELPMVVIMRCTDSALSAAIEQRGVRVYNNSHVSQVANDKWLTYIMAMALRLPVMATRLVGASDELEVAEPCVIKSRNGHGGKEVYMARSGGDVADIFESTGHDTLIVQEIASNVGQDIRCYVIGSDVICAMLRTSDSDFRSNYTLGGRAERVEPNGSILSAVESITSHLKSDFIGVDFILHNGQWVLNEIEDVVGCRMVYSHTDIDIVDKYLEYIIRRL